MKTFYERIWTTIFYPSLSQRLNDHLQEKLDPLQHKKQDTKQPTGAMRWYSTKQEKKPNWGSSNKLPRLSIWRLVYKALAALQYRDRKVPTACLLHTAGETSFRDDGDEWDHKNGKELYLKRVKRGRFPSGILLPPFITSWQIVRFSLGVASCRSSFSEPAIKLLLCGNACN